MPEHRFHTPEPIELEVKIPAGDIVIETVDGEESTVVVEGSEKLAENTFVELRGNRLVVEFRGPKSLGFSIEIGGWRIGNEKLNVHARIPHFSRLIVNTVSGDTNVTGRIASIDAKTMSGDLAVFAEVDGDAAVKTVSGDVRFQASIGRDLQAQTVSGDVRIESVREGRATLQSVSGDIFVAVERGTSLDVDANSVSGDLDSEVALGGELEGIEGDGPTLVVRGKTVSGDFRIGRA